MMLKPILCAAAILALAGCGDSTPAANGQEAIRIANPGSDRLKAARPIDQRIALMRAIRDSGKRCRRVDALGYQQDYRQLAMWVALCDDGRHWAVFIAPNEDIQVRDCREHAQLDLPVCRPVPRVPADPSFPQAKTLPEGNAL